MKAFMIQNASWTIFVNYHTKVQCRGLRYDIFIIYIYLSIIYVQIFPLRKIIDSVVNIKIKLTHFFKITLKKVLIFLIYLLTNT